MVFPLKLLGFKNDLKSLIAVFFSSLFIYTCTYKESFMKDRKEKRKDVRKESKSRRVLVKMEIKCLEYEYFPYFVNI